MSSLLMKLLKEFSAFNGVVQTPYLLGNILKVNRRNVVIDFHTL